MRFDVNVATRPFVNRLPHLVLACGLLVAALGLSAWNASRFLSTRSAARAVESELQEIERREADLRARRAALGARMAAADLHELDTRVDAANHVLGAKALSWTLLLDRLEEVVPYDTALANIHTGVGADGVAMTLEMKARNEDSYLKLLDDLQASPCFDNVYPSVDEVSTPPEVLATVSFDYDPQCGTGAPKPRTGPRARPKRSSGGRRG